MADPEIQISGGKPPVEADVEMEGGDDGPEVTETGTRGSVVGGAAAEEDDKPAPRYMLIGLSSYLKSPMVELLIGSGDSQTLLMAHKALLTKSPFFTEQFSSSGNTRIELVDDDVDPISCFLEYLYTGEYFPHKLSSGALEPDPSAPKIDDSGAQLLKHAKVYTVAEKLGMPLLKSLSHSKIHLITSTAIAEIAYARYVYSHTTRSDLTIRKPVASFWGQRSHVLRHETEGSFRDMCLEYPEFAFDVLSFVLDAEEKRAQRRGDDEVGKSARKRARGQ
ncbi:MAG: hypothetical protein Q9210_000250 [Variospora velana]